MSDNQREKFANRFKYSLKAYGFNPTSLAKLITKSQGTINKAVNGTIDPGVSLLMEVAEVLPEINYDWVITGRGNVHYGVPEEALVKGPAPEGLIDEDNKIENALLLQTLDHAKSEIETLKKYIKMLEAENASLKGGSSAAASSA